MATNVNFPQPSPSLSVCLCGKIPQPSETYILSDFKFCSQKCVSKFSEDILILPSTIPYDHLTHSLCQCGVIYPKSKKFEIYGTSCCSLACVDKMRAENEPQISSSENIFRKPDAGGGFAF